MEASWAGRTWLFTPADDRRAGARASSSGSLTAPMIGVVASVMAAEGDRVEAHQPLLVVEAMKVMATVEAPFAGTLARLHVQAGQQVSLGELLAEVVPLEEG